MPIKALGIITLQQKPQENPIFWKILKVPSPAPSDFWMANFHHFVKHILEKEYFCCKFSV
jgi:hypothetical protein